MKVLIIKTSSMGDIIHTLPAISDASKKIAGITFDWVVEENFSEIPKWHQNVNRVIPIALRRWRKKPVQAIKTHEVQQFLQALRRDQYDYIIDAQGLIKSAIITLLAKGNNRHAKCGFSFTSAKEPIVSLVYQRRIKVKKDQHAIIRLRALFAKIFNYSLPLDFPDFGFHFPTPNKNNKKYLVFIHFASRQSKCWSEKEWQNLIKIAAKANYQVKLLWGNENEKYAAERISENLENVEIMPKMNLNEIVELFLASKGVIAVDTGLAHLAAALNLPTLALYGETSPKLIGIYGKKQKQIENFRDVIAEDVWSEFLTIL